MSEEGEPVTLRFAWERENTFAAAPESHFVCPKPLGMKAISRLLEGAPSEDAGTKPFYVFSAERRRVRITVLRNPLASSGSSVN
jgi:hypothetical protein